MSVDDNSELKKKRQKVLKVSRKHYEKRRNCSLRAISPIPSVFKRLVLETCKNQDLFGKGLTLNIIQMYCNKQSLTHYQMTNFRLFQTERICRRQFQIDENGRKLSKQVENTVGKGEIARHEQFLLFPQCFQKAFFPEASKSVIVWEWVK